MTVPSTDPLTLLSRALDQTATLIAGVTDDQTDHPTPCGSWNVGTLLDHVIHDTRQFTVAATGGQPDWAAPAPHSGPGWLDAFRDGERTLLETWGKPDLTGTVTLPGLGEVPARTPVDQQIAEFAAHSWDIAKATGQSTDVLDPEVAEAALAFVRSALRAEFRGPEEEGKAFGPEVPVPDDAPVYDRLAGFLGREVSA